MTLQVRNETDYLLAKSFKEIACEKPVEKITIKDITDRAGVIRPTFYNHFKISMSFWSGLFRRNFWNLCSPF